MATEADELEELRQLKARYFRMMDTKNWEGLAQVFTDDVEIDVTGEGGGVTHSVADYIPFLRANIEDVITVHHGHMPEIELTGPDTARGIWSMEDVVEFPDGRGIRGYGHYTEEYARVDGQWRIRSIVLTRLRLDPLG